MLHELDLILFVRVFPEFCSEFFMGLMKHKAEIGEIKESLLDKLPV